MKNFFRTALYRLQCWYRVRRARRVFLISFLAALIFLLIAQVEKSGICSYIAISLGIIAIGASAVDTMRSYREFKLGLKYMKRKYFARVSETYDDSTRQFAPECFGPEERKYIKKRKAAYRGTFLLQCVFMIFLIVLLVQDMI